MERGRSTLPLPLSDGLHVEEVLLNTGSINVEPINKIEIVLPDDIVFDHILPKLPVKSLLRFRCICRSWLSLIDRCNRFIERHRLQPQRNIVYVCLVYGQLELEVRDAQLSRVFADIGKSHFKSFYRIMASNDGLLCMVRRGGYRNPSRYYRVLNPWTRKRIDLPPIRSSFFNADQLGFDPTSSTHKLLVFDLGIFRSCRMCMPKIITLGVDASWRKLGPCQEIGIVHDERHFFPRPCVLNGAFHWIYETYYHYNSSLTVRSSYSDHILAFDIGKEKFRTMAYPQIPRTTNTDSLPQVSMSVAVVGEVMYFHYLDERSATIDVWVLRDYFAQTWHKQYSFSCNFLDGYPGCEVCNIMGSLNGDVLSWEAYGRCSRQAATIFTATTRLQSGCRIPVEENTVTEMQWKPLFFKCEESLVGYTRVRKNKRKVRMKNEKELLGCDVPQCRALRDSHPASSTPAPVSLL